MTSSRVPVTPRMTLTRLRSNDRSRAIAGVFQRLPGHHQAEQLRGVDGLQGVRRDAEVQRREIDRCQEAAAGGVGVVGRPGVEVEIVLRPPVRGGDSVMASTRLRMLAQ